MRKRKNKFIIQDVETKNNKSDIIERSTDQIKRGVVNKFS